MPGCDNFTAPETKKTWNVYISGIIGSRADLRPVLECWIYAEQIAGRL